ncbi:IS3 family transposase [Algoriphagus persicinus]|uniref:IS3 family transposase n=1 Tax=Algoriphagus persicinus TaxID=3108754 RepID=UPI002B3BEFCD|nr:IS3 family transposase [Algoriphagus sp. E1-3-M2]MEB2787395.1 IS3 family transposase [Algoriphagus sp. E1-3-M2]
MCLLFGLTRQAYYQFYWHAEETSFEHELVLKQVLRIRKKHAKMGARKLLVLLESFLLEHQIKMGRDALFELLAVNNLLIKRRKRRVHTTNSLHWLRKYPNLIREYTPISSNQLWVSDITYWRLKDRFIYISFITDAYSHKIVGYQVDETLEAASTIRALQMAIDEAVGSIEGLIHHSDRGIQYCSHNYVKLLQDNQIQISMTENGDPLENAVAERINGIVKEEYLDCYEVETIQDATLLLKDVVKLYNQERPHMSIGNLTPEQIHHTNQKTERLWKNYYPKNVHL